jgi:CelD/BcsL family acetyltransferase involved in cellulose biosynthesis
VNILLVSTSRTTGVAVLVPGESKHRHAPGGRVAACGVEILTGLTALETQRAAWTQLWERTPDATPFQSAAWTLAWARYFAPDRTHAVLARTHDGLSALVPFFTWQGKLLLAGTGPSDYGDGLFDTADREIAAAVLMRLCEAATDLACECIDLQQLRVGSPLLDAAAPRGWHSQTSAGTACPVAPVRGPDGAAAVSTHWRKNAERAQRQLQREFELQASCAEQHELPVAAPTLERLHRLRWGTRDTSHAFEDARMRAFLYDAIPQLGADGLLRLQCLRIGGETVAMVFAMGTPRAHYFYMSGFDPRWSRYSTGLITILAAMRQAALEHAQEFHFLRGNETYKYHLGATDQPTYRRILRSGSSTH